jgi:glycosyltransferase involved in cell wall biosynthesis
MKDKLQSAMTDAAAFPAQDGPVAILMGVYEGEKYLIAQLDSIAAQSYANWSLTISDDSPNTGSSTLISRWHDEHPNHDMAVVPGPRNGFARNFLTLIAQTPKEAQFAALCDQDDVWFPDKIARAVAALQRAETGRPALYSAATVICDADLRAQRPSPPFCKAPDFRNALVQSIGGGNTMVLNRAAIDLAQACLPLDADPVTHDWWLYQIVSGHGGLILRDDAPVLLYRQHGGNIIGANMSYKARMDRVRALLTGRFRTWNACNLTALDSAMPYLIPQARQTLLQFAAAREGPVLNRLRALYHARVFRQSSLGTAALYVACLLKRL